VQSYGIQEQDASLPRGDWGGWEGLYGLPSEAKFRGQGMIKVDPKDKDLVIDLILQRTGAFLAIPGSDVPLSNWFKFGNREGLYEHLVSSNMLHLYLEKTLGELEWEAKNLSCAMEDVRGSLVSIGPGNGVIEFMLATSGRFDELMLIDIERTDEHHHGYNKTGAGYTDLDRTRSFITDNLDKKLRISTWNPLKQPLPEFGFDCMISILSMGFHYPCDEYVDFVSRNARKNSLLIFDLRKGVRDYGMQRLSTLASNVTILSESNKSQRLKITIR